MKEIEDLNNFANNEERTPTARWLTAKIVAVLLALTKRIEALEADYDRRQGDGR